MPARARIIFVGVVVTVLPSRPLLMLRRIVICLVVAIAGIVLVGTAIARPRHQINPTPFSHSPCSVLDGQPCTPSFPPLFNHGPSIPDLVSPYSSNLHLHVT